MLTFGAIAAIFAAFWLIWRFLGTYHPSLSHLPSVRGLPILGNSRQLNFNRPDLTFTEWSRKLGGVMAVRIFNMSFVVLSSFEAIQEALVTKGDKFAGRPTEGQFRNCYVTHGFQDIVFSNPNSRWKRMRKLCQRQIKMFGDGLKRLEELNLSVIATLVSHFRSHQGAPFNPREYIYHTMINTMTSLAINRRFGMEDRMFRTLNDIEQMLVPSGGASGKGVELDMFPWLRFFGNSTYKKLERQKVLRQEAWATIKEIVLDDLKGGREVKTGGILHAFMKEYQNQDDQVPEDTRLQEVHLELVFLDMIVAGTTTSTNSFYSFLNILCNYPDVQHKLQEEADRVIGPSRAASLADQKNMPYTHATLFEMLRYISVGALGLPHTTLENTDVQGWAIPKGVMVVMNLWAMHHDEQFWEEPFQFKPERFLDEAGNLLPASHENRHHLMPFGAGPRVCLGEVLAQGRLFLLITTMAQVFDIEPSQEKVSCDPRLYQCGSALSSVDFQIKAKCRNTSLMTS